MDKLEFQRRTRAFALAVVELVGRMHRSTASFHLGSQLLRAATSVAANYRAACRARTKAEFIAKLGVVEEESDEAAFWLDFLAEAGMLDRERTAALRSEAVAILRMTVASIRTARSRLQRTGRSRRGSGC